MPPAKKAAAKKAAVKKAAATRPSKKEFSLLHQVIQL